MAKVTVSASGEVISGNYSLAYTRRWANQSLGYLSSQTETTSCLDWNVDASEVKYPIISEPLAEYVENEDIRLPLCRKSATLGKWRRCKQGHLNVYSYHVLLNITCTTASADFARSVCLATALFPQVEEALEALAEVDDVTVVRSGDASNAYDYGCVAASGYRIQVYRILV